MKKSGLLLLLVAVLTSCYNINESIVTKPDPLFSEEKMIKIITDIQLVEAGFTISENRKTERKQKPIYYQKVFDNYGVTLGQFRENMIYYQASPKVMEDIYEKVLANLIRIQNDVIFDVEEMKRVTDSINKVADSINAIKDADTLNSMPLKPES